MQSHPSVYGGTYAPGGMPMPLLQAQQPVGPGYGQPWPPIGQQMQNSAMSQPLQRSLMGQLAQHGSGVSEAEYQAFMQSCNGTYGGTAGQSSQHVAPSVTPNAAPAAAAQHDTAQVTPPPPQAQPDQVAGGGSGGGSTDKEKLVLVRLTNRSNTYKWSTESIRVSLEQTANMMLGEGEYPIFPRNGGTVGPYMVSMPGKLAEVLLEDEETDLFEVQAESDQDPVTFQVVQLDEQGRELSDEVREKVLAKRAERRAKKDQEESSRTIKFFFDGTPEMLAIMHDTEALGQVVGRITSEVAAKCNHEKINVYQCKDKTGRHTASWIIFVVIKQGETVDTAVDWARVKWIIYDGTRQPVRLRVSGEALHSWGRKQCCFRKHAQCEGTATGECGARDRAFRMVVLPSSIRSATFRELKEEKKARIERQQAANATAMRAQMAARTVRQCERFHLGKCYKGLNGNSKCQHKHDARPETIGCWFNETEFPLDGPCKAIGYCPYDHTKPNEVRMRRREEERARARANTAASSVSATTEPSSAVGEGTSAGGQEHAEQQPMQE